MDGQLVLDLFSHTEPNQRALEGCLEWLHRVHGCSDAVDDVVRAIFEACGCDGYDRAKVMTVLDGAHRVSGFTLADASLFGVFDPTLDYHVCWDRAWAARKGVWKPFIALVHSCDYKSIDNPGFYDANGERI